MQGFGIRLTLFIIFVIDLYPVEFTAIQSMLMILVYLNGKTDIDITEEFQHILKWAKENKCNINKFKTKKLIFH